MEEESVEVDGVGDDDDEIDDTDELVVVVDGEDDTEDSPGKLEVGGLIDVTGGRDGIEVGLSKQTSDEPAATVIAEVALPSPLESERTITTLTPARIVTILQVIEVPLISVKAAAIGPSALSVWKD